MNTMETKITLDESWLQIISLSKNLLSCTQNGNWENTDELSRERHEKIVKHFRLFPVSAENALINQKNMAEFTKIEKNINTEIELEKKKLASESALIKNQRLAAIAYAPSQT